MSARDAGEAAAFSKLANFLGAEFVKASGDAAELKAALAEAVKERDALKASDPGFTPVPGKPDQFTDRDGKLWYCGPEIQPISHDEPEPQS